MRCIGERVAGNVTVLQLASRVMLGELNTEITDKIVSLTQEGQQIRANLYANVFRVEHAKPPERA